MRVVAEQRGTSSKLQIHLLPIDLVRLIISAGIYTSKSYGCLREDAATKQRQLWERMEMKQMKWPPCVSIAQPCSLWLNLFCRELLFSVN